MSYARFGWNGSDVYVYLDVGGFIHCCGCPNNTDGIGYRAYSTEDMINHLKEHQSIGEHVPASVFERLWEEHEENMEFIRETKESYSEELSEEVLELIEEVKRKIKQAEENNE